MLAAEDIYAGSAAAVITEFRAAGWGVRVKNFWTAPENPYQGINLALTSPSGQQVELQLHAQSSFDVKNGEMHALYERWRTSSDAIERNRIKAMMRSLSDTIPIPAGVAAIE